MSLGWILLSTWAIPNGVGPKAYWWQHLANTGIATLRWFSNVIKNTQFAKACWQLYTCFILKPLLISATDCFLWVKDAVTGTMMIPWSNNQLKSYVNEEGSCHIIPKLKQKKQTTKPKKPHTDELLTWVKQSRCDAHLYFYCCIT